VDIPDGPDPSSDERKLKGRVDEGQKSIKHDGELINTSIQTVQSYEESFAQIQKATKIIDIDQLVDTFINAEDTNFSLFNYVNVLSAQIDKYKEQLGEVNEEIKKYSDTGMDGDRTRKALLTDLQNQLDATEKKSEHYETNYQEAMKAVVSLKAGIQRVFHKIGCKDQTGLLGNAGVTENNMMQYLGLIEARSNELLSIYKQQQQAEGVADDQVDSTTNENTEVPADSEPSPEDAKSLDAKEDPNFDAGDELEAVSSDAANEDFNDEASPASDGDGGPVAVVFREDLTKE
jgi:hypothetical protein